MKFNAIRRLEVYLMKFFSSAIPIWYTKGKTFLYCFCTNFGWLLGGNLKSFPDFVYSTFSTLMYFYNFCSYISKQFYIWTQVFCTWQPNPGHLDFFLQDSVLKKLLRKILSLSGSIFAQHLSKNSFIALQYLQLKGLQILLIRCQLTLLKKPQKLQYLLPTSC